MKKRTTKKLLSALLCMVFILQSLVISGIVVSAEAVGATTNTMEFVDSFDYADSSDFTQDGYWALESTRFQGTAPTFDDGVMKLQPNNGVAFNWPTVIGGVNNYASTDTYTFDFDFKITDSTWDNEDGDGMVRILFVAPGGWYNQIEFRNGNWDVRAGDTYAPYDTETFPSLLNTPFHAKLVWTGKTITTTITNAEDGTVFATGSRTNNDYANPSVKADMRSLVLRCENGAVEIDNFKFTAPTANTTPKAVVEGFQTADNGTTADARFVATLTGNYEELEAIGFEFTYNGKTVTTNCRYLYTVLNAGEGTITADEGDYFFCYTLRNMEAGTYTITARAWTQAAGSQIRIYSGTQSITFTVNADGTVTM